MTWHHAGDSGYLQSRGGLFRRDLQKAAGTKDGGNQSQHHRHDDGELRATTVSGIRRRWKHSGRHVSLPFRRRRVSRERELHVLRASTEPLQLHQIRFHESGEKAVAHLLETSVATTGINDPRLAAVMVFWRESLASGKGHVGFYAGEDDSAYQVLGGNQSDKVCLTWVAKNRLRTRNLFMLG